MVTGISDSEPTANRVEHHAPADDETVGLVESHQVRPDVAVEPAPGGDRLDRAGLGVAEPELAAEDVRQRRERVVDTAVADHGQAGEDRDGPARIGTAPAFDSGPFPGNSRGPG